MFKRYNLLTNWIHIHDVPLEVSLCLIEFPSLHDCVLSDHEQVGYDVIIYELRVLQMYVLLYAFFDTANAYGTHWP